MDILLRWNRRMHTGGRCGKNKVKAYGEQIFKRDRTIENLHKD